MKEVSAGSSELPSWNYSVIAAGQEGLAEKATPEQRAEEARDGPRRDSGRGRERRAGTPRGRRGRSWCEAA